MGNSYPIIKLDATGSTNDYLRTILSRENLEDYTVVFAKNQFAGKGQMGNSWVSEPGKNLTFSFLKRNLGLAAKDHFLLNMVVSLALYDTLFEVQVPELCIKWPNDIMSGDSKICGILIENLISGPKIKHSIIGIGLNVNQTNFGNLANVSSLTNTTKKEYELDELLAKLMVRLQQRFTMLLETSVHDAREAYEKLLFRKGQVSNFTNPENQDFRGEILGVTPEGQLVLQLENGERRNYEFKTIRLVL